MGHCEVCFNLATEATCRICQDERRDGHLICVVEEPSDVIPIERTNEFSGRYHVLGGALSPIDGVDPEDLHIAELVKRAASNGVREVVVATNATTTGEATALYLADALRERAPTWRSPALPVACRWARTWSTPMRSRSAGRFALAALFSADPGSHRRRARAGASCVGDVDAVDVQQKPGPRLRFGIGPLVQAGQIGPCPARRCPSSPSARTPSSPPCGPANGPFVLRLNRFFWSDGEEGFQRYLGLAERFTRRDT